MIRTRLRLRYLAAWTLGLAGLLAPASAARAEFFEFASTVALSTLPGDYSPSGSTITNAPGGASATFTSPTGNQVILTALNSNPAVPRNNASGPGTDIVPLSVNANPFDGSEQVQLSFTLNVTITDYPSALAAAPSPGTNPVTLTFTGRIGGQIGDFQTNLNLLSFVPVTAAATIGGADYTVALRNFASPGTDNNGGLSLHVTAVPYAAPHVVPEPGSLALLGMGGALGMFLRRRLKAVS